MKKLFIFLIIIVVGVMGEISGIARPILDGVKAAYAADNASEMLEGLPEYYISPESWIYGGWGK